MLTLRKRLFIIIGVISGLIIALLLGYYFWRDQMTNKQISTDSTVPINSTIDTDQTGQTTGSKPVVNTLEKKPVDMSVYAKQLATIFVERFATYSNQNKNQNIDDVLNMSTPVMAKWLESQRASFGKEYEGVTTSVVATKILSIDNANAMIEVNIQQQIVTTSSMELEQKTGRVELILDGDDWKVDGFYWNK